MNYHVVLEASKVVIFKLILHAYRIRSVRKIIEKTRMRPAWMIYKMAEIPVPCALEQNRIIPNF